VESKPSSPRPRERSRRLGRNRRRLENTSTISRSRGRFLLSLPSFRVSPRLLLLSFTDFTISLWFLNRSDLFNKAYSHISDRIDQVYKDLTKGNASPMGGVAYLSLEDSEVSIEVSLVDAAVDLTNSSSSRLVLVFLSAHKPGTLPRRNQVPRDAADEEIPRYGSTFGRRANGCCFGSSVRYSQVRCFHFSQLRRDGTRVDFEADSFFFFPPSSPASNPLPSSFSTKWTPLSTTPTSRGSLDTSGNTARRLFSSL